ncbi:MAG: SagB/ThcOx family dehydrogenase [Halodesulfurarchaeum sp.]
MATSADGPGKRIGLPEPRQEGTVSVASAIATRRSRRTFGDGRISLSEIGQLLWAAQGVTDTESGFRAAPSAGATFPLEVYTVIGEEGCEDLEAGVYRYHPGEHALERQVSGDVTAALREAALDQAWIETASATIVFAAVDERTTGQYGQRGLERYVPMEAGHAGENLFLQAEALGLGTVPVGAFDDGRVREVLEIPAEERILYLFPVGPKAEG